MLFSPVRAAIRVLVHVCRPAAWALVFVTMAVPSEGAWHRLDSPNFVVLGDASAGQLRDIAVKFEAFREVLGRLRGTEVATAPVPTVILVFRSSKAFTPYKPRFQGRPKEVAGLFVPGRDVNHIAFVNDGEDSTAAVMYHEYAHLLVSNASGRIPVWLNEGLSEVYSTFELTRDGREALIGRHIAQHLELLQQERLLSLPELLQVDHSSPLYNEGERRSVFYAQSWALVHMIIFGEPSRTTELRTYLQRVSEGKPPADAWAQAFGAHRIDKELERYISRRIYLSYQIKFSEKISRAEAKATPLSAAEVHMHLAHFLLRQGRLDEAAEQLAAGTKLADQNAALRVFSAHLDIARGDSEGALKRLLAAGDVEDWLAAYYAGVGLSDASSRAQDPSPEARAAAARYFDIAARQRVFPNAVIRRAAMELDANSVPAEQTVAAVERARAAAPGREDYGFVHAQLLALRSEFAAARAIVGPLLSSAQEPSMREAARSLMGWIVTLEKHRARAAAAPTVLETERSDSANPAAAGEAVPEGGTMQALFRETKPNEERVEGLLQRIECPAGGAGIFVLQISNETVRLATPRMGHVEFITYRDDLGTAVSCGPLKQPMRVYVTSRTGSIPTAAKEVVAVEFLPKHMQ